MGDISEIRGLVVVISFLGVFALLTLWVPAEFFSQSERLVDVPNYWAAIDLQSFKETWNTTLDADGSEYFTIGGRALWVRWERGYTPLEFVLRHRYGFWNLYTENMDFYDREGTYKGFVLTRAILDADYAAYEDVSFTAKAKAEGGFQVKIFFPFNETTYPTGPSAAWNSNELEFVAGINFDQCATSFSAWDLIAQLLFFKVPNIHPLINAIIAIPLWVSIAYLAYVLIIKIIPLIAGG